MNRSLPPLFARSVAIGILVVVVGAVWVFGAVPLIRYNRLLSEDTEFTKEQIVRLQSTLPDRNTLERQIAAIESGPPGGQAYFLNDTESGAAADLQRMFEAVASDSGAALHSTQVTSGDVAAGLRKIGLSADLSVSHAGLLAFLYGLANTRPGLLVEMVEVRGPAFNQGSGTGSAEPLLTVRLQVNGLLQTEPSE